MGTTSATTRRAPWASRGGWRCTAVCTAALSVSLLATARSARAQAVATAHDGSTVLATLAPTYRPGTARRAPSHGSGDGFARGLGALVEVLTTVAAVSAGAGRVAPGVGRSVSASPERSRAPIELSLASGAQVLDPTTAMFTAEGVDGYTHARRSIRFTGAQAGYRGFVPMFDTSVHFNASPWRYFAIGVGGGLAVGAGPSIDWSRTGDGLYASTRVAMLSYDLDLEAHALVPVDAVLLRFSLVSGLRWFRLGATVPTLTTCVTTENPATARPVNCPIAAAALTGYVSPRVGVDYRGNGVFAGAQLGPDLLFAEALRVGFTASVTVGVRVGDFAR